MNEMLMFFPFSYSSKKKKKKLSRTILWISICSSCGLDVDAEPTLVTDPSLKTVSGEKCKNTAHAQRIPPIPSNKKSILSSSSPRWSAAKTNCRCDECNKYDRWDICLRWPHTTCRSLGSRCCSDLQPPASCNDNLSLAFSHIETLSPAEALPHLAQSSQRSAAHAEA